MFLRLFRGGMPKIIFLHPEEPLPIKMGKKDKETVVSARRLLQYFKLPDTTSSDISRYVYHFLRYFGIVKDLFYYFSRNP